MAQPAAAGPFDLFGFGTRTIGMGQAITAVADDYTATFYNPANLVLRKDIRLGAEFLLGLSALEIDLDQPSADHTPIEPETYAGFTLGLLFPLGGKVAYRFAIGAALHLPTEQILRIESYDPLVPRWYLADSLVHKFHFLLGLGFEATRWLSVGVGFQALASIMGETEIDVDWVNEEFTYRTLRSELHLTMSPVVGLRLTPFDRLTVGLSWRGEMELEFRQPIHFDFGEALDTTLVASGHALYTPHVLSLGLAYQVIERRWLASLELRRAFWSQAPDPALYFALDMSGRLLEGLGAEGDFDFLPGPSGLPGFRDILTVHVGSELTLGRHLLARMGYHYRPTPLPQQVGLSNYVDGDAHTLGAGIGIRFADPLEIDQSPISIELSGALSILPEQQIEKLSGSDPVGDYTCQGQIGTLSITIQGSY
ncbi:MAG: outer membrane protein transport protein [Bradymonadales bacterium]|nr:outer membrane protein transport protein [Bradymonadales bacterium]